MHANAVEVPVETSQWMETRERQGMTAVLAAFDGRLTGALAVAA